MRSEEHADPEQKSFERGVPKADQGKADKECDQRGRRQKHSDAAEHDTADPSATQATDATPEQCADQSWHQHCEKRRQRNHVIVTRRKPHARNDSTSCSAKPSSVGGGW